MGRHAALGYAVLILILVSVVSWSTRAAAFCCSCGGATAGSVGCGGLFGTSCSDVNGVGVDCATFCASDPFDASSSQCTDEVPDCGTCGCSAVFQVNLGPACLAPTTTPTSTPVSAVAPAPTLTPWGLIAGLVLLAGTAAWAIRRRAMR
jgi:hypothetical protein